MTKSSSAPIIISFTKHRKLVHNSMNVLWNGLREGRPCKMFRTLEARPQDIRRYEWTQEARDHGILLDLSGVQWCDLTACVHLLLVVERALRDGLPYMGLALPDPARTPAETWLEEYAQTSGETERIPLIRRDQKRRSGALKFLSSIGFQEAARCAHLAESQKSRFHLIENFGSAPPLWAQSASFRPRNLANYEKNTALAEQKKVSLDHAFEMDDSDAHPFTFLRWVSVKEDSCHIQAEMDKLKERLNRVIAHKFRGKVLDFDAETLTNILFHELLENVQVHAGKGIKHCLIGVWARKQAQRTIPEEYPENQKRFFGDWVRKHDFPLLDIAIGDSGQGISTSLESAFDKLDPAPREGIPAKVTDKDLRLLYWSMTRWSSSEGCEHQKRGTRGLFRVLRLTRAYQGMITVQSGAAQAGWDYGGLDRPKPVQFEGTSWVPGTLAQIRFVSRLHEPEKKGSPPLNPENMEYVFGQPLRMKELADEEAKKNYNQALAHLRNALAYKDPGGRHRCVIVPVASLPIKSAALKDALGKLLETLLSMANPGALVLCVFGIAPRELGVLVDALNQTLSENPAKRWADAEATAHHPSNPFWVLDRDLRLHWAGVCTWELPFLRDLLPQDVPDWEQTAHDTSSPPDEKSFQRALGDYRQHQELFALDEENMPMPRFTPADIGKVLLEKTRARLFDLVTADPRRFEMGVFSQGRFLTPTLQETNGWIHIPKAVRQLDVFHSLPEQIAKLRRIKLPKGYKKRHLEQWVENLHTHDNDQFETVSEVQTLAGVEFQDYAQKDRLLAEALELLSVSMGVSLVAHALAVGVRGWLSQLPTSHSGFRFPRYILREPGSMTDVASALRRFLGMDRQPIELPTQSSLRDATEVWDIVEGSSVLICTDVIVTGTGARRIISELVKQRGTPAGVVCLFDLRPADELGKPILDAGVEIPVFSLCQFPDLASKGVFPPDLSKLTLVDPLSEQTDELPLCPSLPRRHAIDDDTFFKILLSSNSLRFGHYVLPQGRHFLFLADPAKFVRDPLCLDAMRKGIKRELQAFVNALPEVQKNKLELRQPLVLLEAPTFGMDVGTALFGENSRKRLHVVHRTDDRSGLRHVPEEVQGQFVVLVLWSSISGASAQQYTYQLAHAGAAAVLTTVLLSRLPLLREEIMRGWSELRVPESNPSPVKMELAPHRTMPLGFRFLARGVLMSYTHSNCPICRQRERIGHEWRRYPTPHLRKFADAYVDETRPSDVTMMPDSDGETALPYFSKFPQDLPGRMLRLQSRFQEMRTSTLSRLKVMQEIQGIAFEDPASHLHDARALLCLLAVESDWFKEPPLCFDDVRGWIAKIAKRVLFDVKVENEEVVLRQAVVCLRASDKRLFARELPDVFRHFLHRPTILEQILYDCFTYLDPQYHHTIYYLEDMVLGLQECRNLLDEKKHAAERLSLNGNGILATLETLLNKAEEYYARVTLDPTSQQSWRAMQRFLGEHLKDNHHAFGLCAKDFRILPFNLPKNANQDGRLGSSPLWEDCRAKWRKAKNHIHREIAPKMEKLIPFLECPAAENYFQGTTLGNDRLVLLRELAQNSGGQYLTRLDELLEGFCQQPPLSTDGSWTEFCHLAQLWQQTLLEPISPGNPESGAALWRFLRGAPCDVDQILFQKLVVKEGREEVARKYDIEPSVNFGIQSARVFCHSDIVQELLEECFTNIERRKIPARKNPPEVEVTLGSRDLSSQGKNEGTDVCIIISNTGSHPDTPVPAGETKGGHGLQRLQRSLKAFGGDLFHFQPQFNEPNSPWDYQVIAFLGTTL